MTTAVKPIDWDQKQKDRVASDLHRAEEQHQRWLLDPVYAAGQMTEAEEGELWASEMLRDEAQKRLDGIYAELTALSQEWNEYRRLAADELWRWDVNSRPDRDYIREQEKKRATYEQRQLDALARRDEADKELRNALIELTETGKRINAARMARRQAAEARLQGVKR